MVIKSVDNLRKRIYRFGKIGSRPRRGNLARFFVGLAMDSDISEGDLIDALPRLAPETIAAIKADPAYIAEAARPIGHAYAMWVLGQFMADTSLTRARRASGEPRSISPL